MNSTFYSAVSPRSAAISKAMLLEIAGHPDFSRSVCRGWHAGGGQSNRWLMPNIVPTRDHGQPGDGEM